MYVCVNDYMTVLSDLKKDPDPVTDMIAIWTSYSDTLTPKTSYQTPESLEYLMRIKSYETM